MKPLPIEGYTALYFTTATIHPLVLEQFKSERKDRDHQFFKDRPLSVALFSEKVVWQKMKYIHQNPTQEKWKLAARAELINHQNL